MSVRTSPSSRHTAVAALLVCAAFSLWGCGTGARVEATRASGELPDQEVTDFVLTETNEGAPQWTMFARYAATYSAKNLVVARGVRVDFFGDDGKRSSELTAREGDIQQQTRDMTARGNVVLATTEGTRMTTEELRFLNRQQRIVSDRLVRVEREGDVLEGIGFESDPDLKHFEFKTRVRATVRTRSGALIQQREGRP